ncbi:MAG: serine/threonine protein kinase [Planctomycetes bacterium]|nr:serine/threonine protein kinase [Planctomycetota bacterium]
MSVSTTDSSWSDDSKSPDVPDFDLIRMIGQGGFGRVWLATNRTTGRLRAVKVISLKRSETSDPAGREIKSITRLEANIGNEHPNLLHIHHVGKTVDHLFYVMDPADDVSGSTASSDAEYRPATLRSRIENGPLGPHECLVCARQLLGGLASLHRAGMVHRDVKPENCLFVQGELKLADFGLVTEADLQMSRVGTRKYMPPDGRMDTRADVYAAGLVIFEMVSGLPADRFPRLGHRAEQVVEDPVLNRLNRLVLEACQPDPQARFPDAGRMLAHLTSTGRKAAARRTRLRRRRVLASFTSAMVAIVLAILGFRLGYLPPIFAERVDVNFITRPFNATVYLNGILQTKPDGTPYLTPCTVRDLSAGAYQTVFKREGFEDLDAGRIDFTVDHEVEASWNTDDLGPQPMESRGVGRHPFSFLREENMVSEVAGVDRMAAGRRSPWAAISARLRPRREESPGSAGHGDG